MEAEHDDCVGIRHLVDDLHVETVDELLVILIGDDEDASQRGSLGSCKVVANQVG